LGIAEFTSFTPSANPKGHGWGERPVSQWSLLQITSTCVKLIALDVANWILLCPTSKCPIRGWTLDGEYVWPKTWCDSRTDLASQEVCSMSFCGTSDSFWLPVCWNWSFCILLHQCCHQETHTFTRTLFWNQLETTL
jgi:hypothetical protein